MSVTLDGSFCGSLLRSERSDIVPDILPSHLESAFVMATRVDETTGEAPDVVASPVERDESGGGASADDVPRLMTGIQKRQSTARLIQRAASEDPQRGRSLVLCFDGTGDRFDNDISNVARLFASLKKGDSRQLTYYQPGIGTYSTQNRSFYPGIPALIDMMFASSVDEHIKQGYRFLMQRFSSLDDRICIFGFSRGAYTARALAAMIHTVGLLPAYNLEQVDEAFRIYKNSVKGIDNIKQARQFKRMFSIPAQVWFVGCWDTVSSVGLIPKKLPRTSADVDIIFFRHCLALDEHRGKFKQRNWVQRTNTKNAWKQQSFTAESDDEDYDGDKAWIKSEAAQDGRPQQVLETWFAGSHADVGGGATRNDTPFALSRITLRWMIRQCYICDTRILFKESELRKLGFSDPAGLVDLRNSDEPDDGEMPHKELIEQVTKSTPTFVFTDKTSGEVVTLPKVTGTSDELADVVDAVTKVHDQLYRWSFWWLLEFWPIRRKISLFGFGRKRTLQPNLGRPRRSREFEPKMHWTVKLREAFGLLNYKPRAVLNPRKGGAKQWRVVG